jgi:hypothetical protein
MEKGMIEVKLLVIARDYSRFVSRQVTYHLIIELAKITDLVVWHEKADNIFKILQQLKIEPDFILILEYWETNATRVTGLSNLSIPFAISLHDLHWDIDYRKELIQKENIKYIFSPYRDTFYEWYPEFRSNMLWLPHHVNINLYKDYGAVKNIDYLMMGAVSAGLYPLRDAILYTMQDKPGFVFHPHPGYRDVSDDEEALVRWRFAREINRAKIFFTCDSEYHYPVSKYYEVPACNTLLLARTSREIEDLGFIPGVHFVAIDENDFEEKAKYYLAHEKERLEIAQQGYEMVRTRHSTARRAADLAAKIEKLVHPDSRDVSNRPGGLGNE